jgi:hypothetical protein
VRKAQGAQAKNRIIIAIACFGLFYTAIGARLVQYGMRSPETVSSISRADQLLISRPDLLDRNGEVLATDIRTVSLFAEPNKIVDPDEAVELLATVLPDLDHARHSPQAVIEFPVPVVAPPADAQAAEPDPGAGHPRHRLPAGNTAFLSGRADGLACCRSRQHRQQGHRRHGEICRRAGSW